MKRMKQGRGVGRPRNWNGDALHDARVAHEMSARELAEELSDILRVTVSTSAVYAWEHGSPPARSVVSALNRILNTRALRP